MVELGQMNDQGFIKWGEGHSKQQAQDRDMKKQRPLRDRLMV